VRTSQTVIFLRIKQIRAWSYIKLDILFEKKYVSKWCALCCWRNVVVNISYALSHVIWFMFTCLHLGILYTIWLCWASCGNCL